MSRRIFKVSLLVSLLVHILLLIYVNVSQMPDFSKKKDTVEIVIDEPPQTKKEDAKQIVQQNDKALNDEIPDNAKYLSKNNQRVVKETKAANQGDFNNKGGKTDSNEESKKQQTKKSAKVQQFQAPDKLPDGLPTMAALKPQFEWNKLGANDAAKKDTTSKTDDFLKDKETGAETMLNTREFLYYSYYNRIRGQLKQYWEPKIKDKLKKIFAQGRSIASDQDRITKVIIHLDDKGLLLRVQVIGESGIRDLDDAAVEAFRAAAPFPNPPKGIVDGDGTIKIRWDFILEA